MFSVLSNSTYQHQSFRTILSTVCMNCDLLHSSTHKQDCYYYLLPFKFIQDY